MLTLTASRPNVKTLVLFNANVPHPAPASFGSGITPVDLAADVRAYAAGYRAGRLGFDPARVRFLAWDAALIATWKKGYHAGFKAELHRRLVEQAETDADFDAMFADRCEA